MGIWSICVKRLEWLEPAGCGETLGIPTWDSMSISSRDMDMFSAILVVYIWTYSSIAVPDFLLL